MNRQFNALFIAHFGAFVGGLELEGTPIIRRFLATSPGDCLDEALRLSSICIYLLSPIHTNMIVIHTEINTQVYYFQISNSAYEG